MYVAHLADGTVVDGNKTPWHDMPRGSLVTRIGCQLILRCDGKPDAQVADDMLSGFDSYGFQMYDVHVPGAAGATRGVQLIGVKGDGFVTVDIDLVTGTRRYAWQPLEKLTYQRSLLRFGVVHAAN